MENPLAMIDPGELAKAKAVTHTLYNRDPYYTANNGLLAARVVGAWKNQKWAEQHFNCHAMRVAPRTLRSKMKAGIMWNVNHATEQNIQSFWIQIQGSIRFSVHDHILVISRPLDALDVMTAGTDVQFTDLQADLIDWMPYATVGKAWHKRGLTLKPEQIQWFKTHLNLPRNLHTFVGAVHPTEVKIVRTAEPMNPELA